MMQRVVAIKRPGSFTASDRVVLAAEERRRRRIVLTGEKGTRLLLDLENPMTLRDGDGLVLDDGTVVQVAGPAELLVEVSTKAGPDLVRLAWHIGNRHTDIQFVDKAFRIRRDHVLEEMLKGLGAMTTEVEAPFDPEPAAPHADQHVHDHE